MITYIGVVFGSLLLYHHPTGTSGARSSWTADAIAFGGLSIPITGLLVFHLGHCVSANDGETDAGGIVWFIMFAFRSDAGSALIVSSIFSLWILRIYLVRKSDELSRNILRGWTQMNMDRAIVVPSISDVRFQAVSVIFGEINKLKLSFSQVPQGIGFIKTPVIQPVVQALKRFFGWILWLIGFIKTWIIQPIVQRLKELLISWVIDLTFLVFVFFFAQEVVGVERSLKANNGLVGENIWSFGQVIAPCFI
jgi:hypothetical protein